MRTKREILHAIFLVMTDGMVGREQRIRATSDLILVNHMTEGQITDTTLQIWADGYYPERTQTDGSETEARQHPSGQSI